MIVFLLMAMVAVVAAIIFVERGHRRITVQYAKRVVGRRQYGGSSTHIPLKVNTGGVIPVIFASSILAFPATMAQMFQIGTWPRRYRSARAEMPLTTCCTSGIIFFAYFYTAIIFNPDDVAENMRKYGGFIPASVRASGRRSTSTRSWRASRWSARCIWPRWRCCRTC